MKIILKLLTTKVNPKTLLLIGVAALGGHLSPELLTNLIDILSE